MPTDTRTRGASRVSHENPHPTRHYRCMPPPFHTRLPHWHKPGAAYFLTWRLAGSLPAGAVADRLTTEGARFVAKDRLLDAAATGPRWLAQPAIADGVVSTLLRGESDGEYELGSWVLMSNHIHVVLRPEGELAKVMATIKARSSREANRRLGRVGQPFWARDYFDRWIRNRIEEERISQYIEQNPVKAGLCSLPEQWRWSSARTRGASRILDPCTPTPGHAAQAAFTPDPHAQAPTPKNA